MKIPYMLVRQKEETFLLTTFKASTLLKHISFHFRQAYSSDQGEDVSIGKYLEDIKKKGIDIEASSEGIQRRLQLNKINKIKQYLQKDEESFFPNAVILSTDLSKDDQIVSLMENNALPSIGELELPEDVRFTIVDGQHRLAGLSLAIDEMHSDFDIPAILLINITINTCAKIFVDVNGTQSIVNKSVIYDLYEMRTDSEQIVKNKKLHSICKKFNTDQESPLYRHIKMLGIGDGVISQAFFVDAIDKALKNAGLSETSVQNAYTNLFFYFRAFQRVFQNQWPVLEKFGSYQDFRIHSEKVMKLEKSQMLKTNGFGGIVKAFPYIYESLDNHDFDSYYNEVKKLENKIDWCRDPEITRGTGAKNQDIVKEKIINALKGF